MKIILSIEHPAWAHQFRYVIKELERKGHTFKVVAINKDRDLELLNAFGIPYEIISRSSGKNIVEKGIIFLVTILKIFFISKKFKPDLFLGRASPMMAINSYFFRKPHIVFEDTEHSTFCLFFCNLFSDVIITSTSFKKDLGSKQLRIDTYKELFYLHPNWFTPNPKILDKLGISPQDKYIIIRFVAWNAHHDISQHGIRDKIRLVKNLEQYGRIFITSEDVLPSELQPYQIQIPAENLHDLLYYATLYIGEGSTTASECAVLGTYAIYVNTLKLGYIMEESDRYHLVSDLSSHPYTDETLLIEATNLLKNENFKQETKSKRNIFKRQCKVVNT